MSGSLNAFGHRHDRITISTIHVAVALSLLLHALLLSGWLPKLPQLTPDELPGKPNAPLAVRLVPLPGGTLVPPPSHSAPPSPQVRPAPMPRMPSTQTPVRPNRSHAPRPSAPVLSAERAEAPALAPSPPADDFAALVEARRRSREAAAAKESAPAPRVESQRERDSRIAAANLGLNRTPTFGSERKNGGGVFQIARIGYDDAEFFFFGWNKAIRRNAQQMIEVRRGDNPTTEIAVVRKMIAIIREHETEDFVWESHRLGRDVRLSARLSDNAGLEDFMMREFFSEARPRN